MFTKIINGYLKICCIPTAWKKRLIISIPKPGKDYKLLKNHCPIALLPSLSKIDERITLSHMQKYLNTKVTPKHSTTFQLTKLSRKLSENFNQNIQTASIFIDIEKPLIKSDTEVTYSSDSPSTSQPKSSKPSNLTSPTVRLKVRSNTASRRLDQSSWKSHKDPAFLLPSNKHTSMT